MSTIRRRWTTICVVLTALIPLAAGACSLVFSTNNDQCTSDGDCAARGPEFQGTRCSANGACLNVADAAAPPTDAADADAAPDPFACANLPAPNPDPSKPVEVAIRYIDFSSGMPPTDTVVRLCGASDPNCLNPRTSLEGAGPGDAGPEAGAGWVVPRPDGTLSGKVELGFEGFFESRGPKYPINIHSTSPSLREPRTEFQGPLLRHEEIKFLADTALGKPDAYDTKGHGLVFLFAEDCNHQRLGGASFTTSASDPMMQLFYIINTAPSITDTKSDSLGRGGFLNVPPGIHTFSGYVGEGDSKRRFGSGRVLVRSGVSTTIAVAPSL